MNETWFRLLRRRLRFPTRQPQRPEPHRIAAVRPRVEALEDRTTPSLTTVSASAAPSEFASTNASYTDSAATPLTQTVAVVPTTTSLRENRLSDRFPGSPRMFIVTVSAPAGAIPTGTVTFRVDGGAAVVVPLIPGVVTSFASFSTSLALGDHTITAEYTSDSITFANSSAPPLAVTEIAGESRLVLTSSHAISSPGEAVTFTARGRFIVFGFAPATGSVTFFIDGVAAATVPLDATETATFQTSSLTAGTHVITAEFTSDNPLFVGSSAAPLTQTVRRHYFAVGTEAGVPAQARVFDSLTGEAVETLSPFDGFTGGVRVAVGDVNGDGFDDIIAAAGPGAGSHVKVFSGADLSEIASFFAFGTGFSGGVNVGSGDVNGDGRHDIIVGAGPGAGPHVKVFDGATGAEIASFFAYANFSGGVNVAAGDVDGDGRDDIITGAASAAPHVKVFSGDGFAEIASFFAYAGFSGGVFVGSGDIDGDGRDEIITGAVSEVSHVKVFSGVSGDEHASFVAFHGASTGVRVGSVDRNDDGRDDIVATAVIAPHVKVFDGLSLEPLDSFLAFPPVG